MDPVEILIIYIMKALFLSHVAIIILISGSCSRYYGHEINLSADIDHQGAVCSPDYSQIYFVCQARAWQKGRNLWFILPVEGQVRNLYNNVSLYSIDTAGVRLTRLFDCGDLPYSLSRWKAVIVPSREGVTFSRGPKHEGWDEKSSKDPGSQTVRQKLEGVFLIDRDGEVNRADSHFPGDDVIKPERELKYYVRHLPYSEYGLILKEFDPETEKYYLKTLENLENSSSYRRAVIEQVLAGKDKKTISRVYDSMLKNLDRMKEGSKKMMKEIAIRDNLEQIQALLDSI